MSVKIHPGIGVARVGDSPTFFIGPETPFDVVTPLGGFRDAECRIKRAAALFRIFNHEGDTVTEITADANTTITWSVRVRRSAFDDPEVSLGGAIPSATATNSGLAYAELQTDSQGRLLVCSVQTIVPGGSNDSRCEGYVHASVVQNGIVLDAIAPAWVIIYPPDFAPGLDPDSGGASGTLLDMWPGLPPTDTDLSYTEQLDRGPLTFVGDWDASGAFGALAADDFMEAFRFKSVGPGMSLRSGYGDWSSDLLGISPTDSYCGCSHLNWLSGVGVQDATTVATGAKGGHWAIRGFLAEQGDGSLEYVDWCPVISAPAEINFYQVPQGTERAVPIHLQLKNFPEVTMVTSTVIGQPNARLESDTWHTPIVSELMTVPKTVWAFFQAETTTPLGLATGTIEFQFDARHTVSIPIRAEVVEPTTVAVALVLDCSDSMSASRGDSRSRLEGLQEAVNVFLDVARPGMGVAVAPFSTDVLLPVLTAKILGSGDSDDEGTGGMRRAVRDFVAGLTTRELTAIGAGILKGEDLVTSGAVAAFDRKSLIVVTDGFETEAPYIHDVADSITSDMYAVGIGPAFEDALREIVDDHEGFVSVAGSPVSPANRFALEKYFLQVLAGVAADDILVDPEGQLAPGQAHRIPFLVSDADMALSAVVVSSAAARLSIALEGPNGQVSSLEELRATGRCRVTRTSRVGHVELAVPFDSGAGVWTPGDWALLVANGRSQPPLVLTHGFSQGAVGLALDTASYLAMVTTSSALHFDPSIRLGDGRVLFEAELSYGGAPVLRDTSVWVEVTTPSKIMLTLPLAEVGPGRFRAQLETSKLGNYRGAFRARGRSFSGLPFQRERVIEEVFSRVSKRRPPRVARDCCTGPSKLWLALARLEQKLCGSLGKRHREPRG